MESETVRDALKALVIIQNPQIAKLSDQIYHSWIREYAQHTQQSHIKHKM